MRPAATRGVLLAACWLLVVACAGRRADLEFRVGGPAAAIDAYEAYLEQRGELAPSDARRLLRLAAAYADPGSPRHDVERARRYWQWLVDTFPRSAEARQAHLLLDALRVRDRVTELEHELARRDEQLARLDAVLQSVALAETRLRTEVESKDEARADLEGRVAALTRQARALSEELGELQGELDALKRIDLEGVEEDAADPP